MTDDRLRVAAGGILGAIVGSLTAYLLFTEGGRDRLSRVTPAVDDLSRLLQDTRSTLGKLGEVALEGRRAAADLLTAFSEDSDASRDQTWH